MRYDWRGNCVVVIYNFDEWAHEARIGSGVASGETLLSLLPEEQSQADNKGMHRIALDAYGYQWYRVGDLNDTLNR
jgi:maltose alpha-D-glucosyltransferase/alpha-amylase